MRNISGIRRSKWIYVISIVVLGSLTLAIGVDAAAAKTTVRVFSWWQTAGYLDTIKAAFEAKNPDIEIRYEVQPSATFPDKLQTLVAAGDAPDVTMMPFDKMAMFAKLGVIQDIDQLVRTRFPYQEMYPSIQRSMLWRGHYYAVPRDITSNLLFYNKAHLSESGIAFPVENWTWQDFTNATKRLTSQNHFGFVTDFYPDGYYHWFPTNGADWFNEDRTKLTIDSTASLEVFDFLYSLVYNLHVAPNPTELKTMTNGATGFQSQRASMYIGGASRAYGWQSDKALTWDVSMIPKGSQHGNRVWANLWSIPSGAKNKEAAWRVLAYFAGAEGQKLVGELHVGIPAIRSVARVFFTPPPDHNELFLRALEVGIPYPVIESVDAWNVILPELTRIWNNEIPPQTAAANIIRLAQPLLSK